ncbi:MAG: hypothetical protein JW928_05270 [Candidatus Aureabacteria bacterium]|nr:hypothetical protein [Candidatus Auribacterota bacterium]
MPDNEDPSKQKRSAFVEDEKIEKINRTLRQDSVVEEEQVIKGKDREHPAGYHYDSNKNIIKSKDFRYNPKPYIVGGAIDSSIKEPEVEVIKDADGNVMKIKVKCTCGREVDIDCVY